MTPESKALLERWHVDVEREREGRTGYLDWQEVTDRLAAIEAAAAKAERERIAAALRAWPGLQEHPTLRAILTPEGEP